MIILISLGLYEKEDMSYKAIQTAKTCDKLYLESYTHFYQDNAESLKEFLGKEVIEVGRSFMENDSANVIEEAKKKTIGILVGGDCLSATTHTALILEAKEKGVEVKTIHGSSIFTAITETGLELYKFGKVTSIPFEQENVKTPYEVLELNGDLHTLMLLDLRPKEKRYLTANEAIEFLLKVEKEENKKIFSEDKICIMCGALGSTNQKIKVGKAKDLLKEKLEVFPQCLIIPGKMHFMEKDFLESLQ